MPVTVRYPLDYTCSTIGGCNNELDYPIVGYQPTGIVAHLDASYPWLVTATLQSYDPVNFGQNIISARFDSGVTDVTGGAGATIPSNATKVTMQWLLVQNTNTAYHYTGWADITYGDVGPEPPVALSNRQQMVTILG